MPNDQSIYGDMLIARRAGTKKLAVLLDPDKVRLKNLEATLELAAGCGVDYFFIGGSLVVNNMLDELLTDIRKRCKIPLILFPGNSFQLSYRADALLFLSLISGRNAELLIGSARDIGTFSEDVATGNNLHGLHASRWWGYDFGSVHVEYLSHSCKQVGHCCLHGLGWRAVGAENPVHGRRIWRSTPYLGGHDRIGEGCR
jgi:hypothetical protein